MIVVAASSVEVRVNRSVVAFFAATNNIITMPQSQGQQKQQQQQQYRESLPIV